MYQAYTEKDLASPAAYIFCQSNLDWIFDCEKATGTNATYSRVYVYYTASQPQYVNGIWSCVPPSTNYWITFTNDPRMVTITYEAGQ